MDRLPNDMNMLIMLDLDIEDFENYCKNNKLDSSICKDEYLNKQRSEKYLPFHLTKKTDDVSWYKFYTKYSKSKLEFNSQLFFDNVILSGYTTLKHHLLVERLDDTITEVSPEDVEITQEFEVLQLRELSDEIYLIKLVYRFYEDDFENDVVDFRSVCDLMYDFKNGSIKYIESTTLERKFDLLKSYFNAYVTNGYDFENDISFSVDNVTVNMIIEDGVSDTGLIYRVKIEFSPDSNLLTQHETLLNLYGEVVVSDGQYLLETFYVMFDPDDRNKLLLLDEDKCFTKLIHVLSYEYIEYDRDNIQYDFYEMT